VLGWFGGSPRLVSCLAQAGDNTRRQREQNKEGGETGEHDEYSIEIKDTRKRETGAANSAAVARTRSANKSALSRSAARCDGASPVARTRRHDPSPSALRSAARVQSSARHRARRTAAGVLDTVANSETAQAAYRRRHRSQRSAEARGREPRVQIRIRAWTTVKHEHDASPRESRCAREGRLGRALPCAM